MMTRDKIDDLAQLRGKKIGINRLGGKSSLVLRVMLEDAGLNTSKDVTLLQLGGSQERLAALIRGGIDAAPVDFAFEPKMKQMGFPSGPGQKDAVYERPDHGDGCVLESEPRQMVALRQSVSGSDAIHDDQ